MRESIHLVHYRNFNSYFYLSLFSKILLIVLVSIITMLPNVSAQMAKQTAPLSDGYLRLMSDGTLTFNGQIEVRGEFLAGGSLDSSNPNYEQGLYYSIESQIVHLEGSILDLHYDGFFYYILRRSSSSGNLKLLIFDKPEMSAMVHISRLKEQVDLEDSGMEALQWGAMLGVALSSGGSILANSADSPITASVCIAIALTSFAAACVPPVERFLNKSSQSIRTNSDNQIAESSNRTSIPEIFEGSVGFYNYEGEPLPHLMVTDEDQNQRRLLPLTEIGREVHRMNGRLCEVGFLGL